MRKILIVGALTATALFGGGFAANAHASAPSKPAAPLTTNLDECGGWGETTPNTGPTARKAKSGTTGKTCPTKGGETGPTGYEPCVGETNVKGNVKAATGRTKSSVKFNDVCGDTGPTKPGSGWGETNPGTSGPTKR